MKREINIEGMTCNGCVASVQRKLSAIEGVTDVRVSLDPSVAILTARGHITTSVLQNAAGQKYTLTENNATVAKNKIPEASLTTYKPLILIVSFIAGVCFFSQYNVDQFSWMLWMRHFMAGFFIVFAFFKMLNLEGFASSYSMYDIIAKRCYSYGFVYPFLELGLGILYLTNSFPYITNVLTIVILGISSIGVIESNLNERKIKCACLGDVFNLPMTTVTIVENVSMIVMAIVMLML